AWTAREDLEARFPAELLDLMLDSGLLVAWEVTGGRDAMLAAGLPAEGAEVGDRRGLVGGPDLTLSPRAAGDAGVRLAAQGLGRLPHWEQVERVGVRTVDGLEYRRDLPHRPKRRRDKMRRDWPEPVPPAKGQRSEPEPYLDPWTGEPLVLFGGVPAYRE